jgi:predicted  nucleic acid-binding Zn-ribbon protein
MKELIERLRNDCYQEDEVRAHAKEAADALERLTIENAQLQKDYTRIKESATLWHDRYKTKCQEYMDRQAILGAEIVALEAERDALQEGLDGWLSRYLDCEVERDALEEQMTADRKQFLDVRDERNALRATCERAIGCIDGLLKRTPVRDVAETLAEIDAAIGEKHD